MQELAPESPFSTFKNKQPNLASLRGRLTLGLTPSSDLALSRSSSVQRSFFCGDVIAITSWAPDVVNLVRPNIYNPSRSRKLNTLDRVLHGIRPKLLIG